MEELAKNAEGNDTPARPTKKKAKKASKTLLSFGDDA